METANVLLALGGDSGNTVMKMGVTAAEIALLRAIHGDEAVTDIAPTGDHAETEDGDKRTKRTNREELARLRSLYPARSGENNEPIVNQLFPGAAARVYESIDELELDESLFKPVERAKPGKKADKPAKAAEAEEPESLDHMTKPELVAEAKRRGVDIDPSAKKDVILAALKSAKPSDEPKDDEDDEGGEDNTPPLFS